MLHINPLSAIGLYLHIPYCRALCHYCDFAKTANFTDEHRDRYCKELERVLIAWLQTYEQIYGQPVRFTSIFIGGGTPSIETIRLRPIFEQLKSCVSSDIEITLEANPDDCNHSSIGQWQELGVNRISLGLQSFQDRALGKLGRRHNRQHAMTAVRLVEERLPTWNLDLIYGWPDQTIDEWRQDLTEAIASQCPHLSLYTLTYEPRTPLGRLARRGHVEPQSGDDANRFYLLAQDLLGAAGFVQEEVANWSRPGHSCRHNWLYWQEESTIGIGAGAHGYLKQEDGIGRRYAYDRNDRLFAQPFHSKAGESACADLKVRSDQELIWSKPGLVIEHDRNSESWLLEYLASGLRTERGIDIVRASKISKTQFNPVKVKSSVIIAALDSGLLSMVGSRLILAKSEWFRENYWILQVFDCFSSQ